MEHKYTEASHNKKNTNFFGKKNIIICFLFLFSFFFINNISSEIYDQWDPEFNNNLELWYHLNNDSDIGENDTNVYDYSRNGNNGTISGNVEFIDGITYNNSRAMEFDGYTSYITSNSSRLNILDNLTISAWINIANLSESPQIVARSGTNYRLRVEANNNIWFYDGTDSVFGGDINTNQWTHVALVADSSGKYIYINGELVANDSTPYSPTDSPTGIFYVGRYDGGEYMNGSIDEVMVYNKSLSQTNIIELFKQSRYNCLSPYVFLNISESANLCFGKYNLTDKIDNSSEYIRIINNNIKLNGNNTLINYGNYNSRSISLIKFSNIENISISNINISIDNCSIDCHAILCTNSNNINITYINSLSPNNIMSNFRFDNIYNLLIKNNNISSYGESYSSTIDVSKSNIISIIDNYINTIGNYNSFDIDSIDVRDNSANIDISNNNIIRTSNSSTGFGIQVVDNIKNVTISNNNIAVSGNSTNYCGIKIENHVNDSLIINNNITVSGNYSINTNSNGIMLDSVIKHSIIRNNIINTFGGYIDGIDLSNDPNIALPLESISNISIEYNNISTSGEQSYTIHLHGILNESLNLSIVNNNINNNLLKSYGDFSYGIRMILDVNYNNISNNNISTFGNGGFAFVLDNGIHNNIFNNNTIYLNSTYGVGYLVGDIYNNIISNSNIFTTSYLSSTNHGILTNDDNANITIDNIRIIRGGKNTGSYDIFNSNYNNNIFNIINNIFPYTIKSNGEIIIQTNINGIQGGIIRSGSIISDSRFVVSQGSYTTVF